MSKHNEKSLKEVLRETFDDMHISKKIAETRITGSWEKIVGKTIAKHTRKLFINKGTLFLFLDNPSLKNELLYERDKIIQLANEAAEEEVVKEVVIK
jgi:predicted nucleic acid-binding Zn ribbon protein